MAVDLTQFEQGKPFPGDGPAALAALQQRVARLNLAQVAHGRRLIVLFEGWDGSGRKAIIRQLHQEIVKAAQHPEVQRRMAEVGAEPVGSSPAEFGQAVNEQIEKVRPLVSELKLIVQ